MSAMKVIAYMALHYGKPYVYWSTRSVIADVEEFHVLYSAVGSHGTRVETPCPDTRDELYSKIEIAAGSKLRWHEDEWAHEGFQRESIHGYAPDADVILVVDSDEIWPDGLARAVINECAMRPLRVRRLPMIHYWRSFYRAVLHDPAFPERVIMPLVNSGEDTFRFGNKVINHMGYALPPELVQYKWCIHGHQGEYRRDCDWFRDKYLANAQTDCHPVGSEYWNPEAVNPADYMPEFMKAHPYWAMEVIA